MRDQVKKYQIPFGEFRGRAFEDIPLEYLDWLISLDWFKKGFPVSYKYLVEYLEDSIIRKELERKLNEK